MIIEYPGIIKISINTNFLKSLIYTRINNILVNIFCGLYMVYSSFFSIKTTSKIIMLDISIIERKLIGNKHVNYQSSEITVIM